MNLWVFSSRSVENIRVAKDRLIWGFWDREIGEKQRRNYDLIVEDFVKAEGKVSVRIM